MYIFLIKKIVSGLSVFIRGGEDKSSLTWLTPASALLVNRCDDNTTHPSVGRIFFQFVLWVLRNVTPVWNRFSAFSWQLNAMPVTTLKGVISSRNMTGFLISTGDWKVQCTTEQIKDSLCEWRILDKEDVCKRTQQTKGTACSAVWTSWNLAYFDQPGRGVWKCRTQTQKCSRCRWGQWWIWGPWPPGPSWWDALHEGTVWRLSMALLSCKRANPIMKAQIDQLERQMHFCMFIRKTQCEIYCTTEQKINRQGWTFGLTIQWLWKKQEETKNISPGYIKVMMVEQTKVEYLTNDR